VQILPESIQRIEFERSGHITTVTPEFRSVKRNVGSDPTRND
jgi:hypothetical protein